jgi:predicted GNAT superfamily acetyltransferase
MLDPIGIRDFAAADLADVLAINSGASPGVSRLDPLTAGALISMASIAWIAVREERVAGYLIGFLPASGYDGEEFLWFRQRRKSFIYVDQIAVAASSRGHGIGRRFYAELARWGCTHSCRSIVCEVNLVPPNPASLAFHRTCGFSEVGRLLVSDGREVALMERAGTQGVAPAAPCR